MPDWNVCARKNKPKANTRFRDSLFRSFFAVRIFQFISSSSSENDSCSEFGQNLLLLLSSFAGEQRSAAPSSIILEMKKPKNGQAAHRSHGEEA